MVTHRPGVLTPAVHEGDHSIGLTEARVTLVEYGDYQCARCARAYPIVVALRARLGASLRFVFRNYPLVELHPESLHAAEATESVAAHAGTEAYWAMHGRLFGLAQDSERALDDAHLVWYAASVGADPGQVMRDLTSGTYEEHVREDFLSGFRSGVNGTPTFFINGARFDGAWTDPLVFAAALERGAEAHGSTREPIRRR